MSDNRIDVSRRSLLRVALATPLAAGLLARLSGEAEAARLPQQPDTGTGPFTLPPLPYDAKALEPHIDRATMQIHHDRHHATYVKNLNEAVGKAPELKGKAPDELIKMLDQVPESVRTAVRNNGGGHVNHTMFWAIMSPKAGGAARGAIGEAITGTFGSFDKFQTAFNDAGPSGSARAGCGWSRTRTANWRS
jgi:Fe-Mn family superoxide dismutase